MKSGQALILLMIFMMVAITVIAASIFLAIGGSQVAGRQVTSWRAYDIAESGAENALMMLLRNPNYYTSQSTETLTVGEGVATITVTGSNYTNIATSSGKIGNYVRTIQVTTVNNGGQMVVQSWKEIYP